MTGNLSASVLARLLHLAKTRGDDYNLLLNRFALERFLYRISQSRHAGKFLLKGALLFAVWYDEPHRPTRDVDLLGFGPADTDTLTEIFRSIATMDVADGIVFDAGSVCADSIRENNMYGGTRINLTACIGSARCTLQIDVGFGDAVTPDASVVTFPTLLQDFQAPVLRVYPVYSVIAEKYQAMVMLGHANSRMKDFYDLAVIARRTELEGVTLTQAIVATFARRETSLPTKRPLALTRQFGEDAAKVRQWQAFLNKNRIDGASLAETTALLDALLWPPTMGALNQSSERSRWMPNPGKWQYS